MNLSGAATGFASGRGAPYLVAAAALAVFAVSLGYDFVFDDVNQILGNPWIWDARHLPDLLTSSVWSFSDLQPSNYYRPVQMFIYFLDARLFGQNPFGFHLTNVAMHALAAAAAFLLLRRVTGRRRALFAALLFAVHPAHVESVAWIAGSTDVNCALMVFLSLIAWSRSRRERLAERSGAAWLALTGGLFALAMLCKEIAIVTPILALALPERDSDRVGRNAGPAALAGPRLSTPALFGIEIRAIAGAALAFGSGLMVYIGLRIHALGTLQPVIARPELGALEVMAGGLALIPRYLAVAFLPWRPVPDRIIERPDGLFELLPLTGLLILVAAVIIGTRLARRAPAISFGMALLLLPLLPVLRIDLFTYDSQPDRYLYLPSLGACLLVAETGRWLVDRLGEPARRAAVPVCIVLLAVSGMRTVTAAAIWRNDETLGRAGIALEPRSITMHLVLISALDRTGRRNEALEVAQRAAALDPRDRRVQAATTGLRARLVTTSGQDAITIYEEALERDPVQPHLWASLAASYVQAGRPDEAIQAATRALDIDRNNTVAMLNLGTARGVLGDHAGQEREARRLLAIDADSAPGWLNLGAARLALNHPADAEQALTRALEYDSGLTRAHLYLSLIASRRKDGAAALHHAERARDLDPDDAEIWNRLGIALVQTGRRSEARAAWERVLELRPGHKQATGNLQRLEQTDRRRR